MKRIIAIAVAVAALFSVQDAQARKQTAKTPEAMVSIQSFGVLPTNTPEVNRDLLQKAIDEASASGTAIYVTPVENGYPVATGLILRRNVSLIGAHGPLGRASSNPDKTGPTGSLFVITDNDAPFITCESSTQLRGLQFYYPEQNVSDPSKVIEYKPTITLSKEFRMVECVTLSCLSFYGEYEAIDCIRGNGLVCEQILCEHLYGYPLSGKFISIDYCYDIPRILHCHVNPATMREFGKAFSRDVIDSVIARGTFTYWIDHTDNAVIVDLFTFGVYGALYVGPNTYGQLTSFNFDCVNIGVYKDGAGYFNRDWNFVNGSIIANCGKAVEDVHPFLITGKGHTTISNVIAFSGKNHALTAIGNSWDFVQVEGNEPLSLIINSCRMGNYVADNPITAKNPNAKISVTESIDKDWNFFEFKQNK